MEASGLTPEQEAAQRQPGQVPHVDAPPSSPEDVAALAAEFAEYRKEIKELRDELRASRISPKFLVAVEETEDDRRAARLADIAQHEYYCHGCGALYHYPQKCTGTAAAPHPPIEVISTDELAGDPAQHTAAPATVAVG